MNSITVIVPFQKDYKTKKLKGHKKLLKLDKVTT